MTAIMLSPASDTYTRLAALSTAIAEIPGFGSCARLVSAIVAVCLRLTVSKTSTTWLSPSAT